MKIALVEDEKNVRLAVKIALQKEGFEIEEFTNGKEALDALNSGSVCPDLYVLDIMMPVMDGILFLQNYKKLYPETPAIFLTSRDEEFDRVLGLELGADDYLCKPFSMKELVARIKAVLRRYNRSEQKIEMSKEGIVLDNASYTVTLDGQNLAVTITEFRLLETFIRNSGMVLTRDQLIEAAYPEDTYLNDRAVDCHIKRLRKKIGNEKIETVYGLGYKYVE